MSNKAVGWSSIELYIIYFQEVTPQQALTVNSFKQPTRTLWFEGSSLAYSLTFMHDMLMRPDSVCIKVWREGALAASSSAGWTTEVLDASHCAYHWGDRKWCLIQFLHIVCVYTGLLKEWNMSNDVCGRCTPRIYVCGCEFDRQAAVFKPVGG